MKSNVIFLHEGPEKPQLSQAAFLGEGVESVVAFCPKICLEHNHRDAARACGEHGSPSSEEHSLVPVVIAYAMLARLQTARTIWR